MIERETFLAPDGTLFLLGKTDILLTTLEGREAKVPWSDFAALVRHLLGQLEGTERQALQAPAYPLRLIQGGS